MIRGLECMRALEVRLGALGRYNEKILSKNPELCTAPNALRTRCTG